MPQNPEVCFLQTASRPFYAIILAAFFAVLPARAQQEASANTAELVVRLAPELISPKTSSGMESPAPVQTVLKNDRLFGVLANYTTVEHLDDDFGKLPPKTKFKLSFKTMSDPVTISFLGGLALLGQARNSDPSYGQGLKGYSKRYATLFANTGIGTLMTTSVLPAALHQDPRYFQSGQGGVWHRAMYSVSRIFVTRSDRGELQFNYSEIAGNAIAAGISNTYLPQSQRTVGNTLNVWGTDILLNALCNMAKEFWPDLRRKIHQRKHPNETD